MNSFNLTDEDVLDAGVAKPGQFFSAKAERKPAAQGLGPCPEGVRGFKSHPPHALIIRWRWRIVVVLVGCALVGVGVV